MAGRDREGGGIFFPFLKILIAKKPPKIDKENDW